MGIKATFEDAWLAACDSNRREHMADPTPPSIDLAAELRRRGWTGTAVDAKALARELGAKLADL